MKEIVSRFWGCTVAYIAKRSVFVVAVDAVTPGDENEFATDAKEDIHLTLKKCDGLLPVQVIATGLGVIEVIIEAHTNNAANSAFNTLVKELKRTGYRVLDLRPPTRVNTNVPGTRRKPAVIAEATAANPPKAGRQPPPQVAETRTVIFTGTAEEVKRRISYMHSLTGVTVLEPPDSPG
jgi:hypothetical protein